MYCTQSDQICPSISPNDQHIIPKQYYNKTYFIIIIIIIIIIIKANIL